MNLTVENNDPLALIPDSSILMYRSQKLHFGSIIKRPILLDLFCGVGGWSKAFLKKDWDVVGVDIEDFSQVYPGIFWRMDVRLLKPQHINQFDAVVSSPPCDDFARAWLPWLRGDKKPTKESIELLQWSVGICTGHKNRITECSVFAGRHVPGGQRHGSYTLWGDIPPLMPAIPRKKMAKSGMKPELRAEIPFELAGWIASIYSMQYLDTLLEKSHA